MPTRKSSRKTTRKAGSRTVTVAKGLAPKEGRRAVIRKALRTYGGDYRGASYNAKTGKGGVV